MQHIWSPLPAESAIIDFRVFGSDGPLKTPYSDIPLLIKQDPARTWVYVQQEKGDVWTCLHSIKWSKAPDDFLQRAIGYDFDYNRWNYADEPGLAERKDYYIITTKDSKVPVVHKTLEEVLWRYPFEDINVILQIFRAIPADSGAMAFLLGTQADYTENFLYVNPALIPLRTPLELPAKSAVIPFEYKDAVQYPLLPWLRVIWIKLDSKIMPLFAARGYVNDGLVTVESAGLKNEEVWYMYGLRINIYESPRKERPRFPCMQLQIRPTLSHRAYMANLTWLASTGYCNLGRGTGSLFVRIANALADISQVAFMLVYDDSAIICESPRQFIFKKEMSLAFFRALTHGDTFYGKFGLKLHPEKDLRTVFLTMKMSTLIPLLEANTYLRQFTAISKEIYKQLKEDVTVGRFLQYLWDKECPEIDSFLTLFTSSSPELQKAYDSLREFFKHDSRWRIRLIEATSISGEDLPQRSSLPPITSARTDVEEEEGES